MNETASRSRMAALAAAAAKSVIRLYPSETRRRFGEDLASVIDQAVDEAFAAGGALAVLRVAPGLFADLLTSLAVEYGDRCRAADSVADRFVLACLAASAGTWVLMGFAAAAGWQWARAVLDANLALTMLLAFGLPAAALGASRLCLAAGPRSGRGAVLHRLSLLGTVGAWSILATHLLAHA